MGLTTRLGIQSFKFDTVKEVLAKANEIKSGDVLAKIAAQSEIERVAAKQVLSELTLESLRQEPVLSPEIDEVSKFIDENLNETVFAEIKNLTVSELREFLLEASIEEIRDKKISEALTGEMAAAVCKLMSTIDLISASQKLRVVSKAKTTLGLPQVLACRLQPNHPSDSWLGIKQSILEGISYGIGDAVIGINPACDTVESVEYLLAKTDELIQSLQIPTQNCVLSHLSTQVRAIERGAPAGLIFQSIAGSQKANQSFGIDIEMLEEASSLGKQKSGYEQFMYFETGQGSELSSRTHNDADQLTLEARCYALARHFNPFLINDVVGFIGPEYLASGKQMIRAGLEDHFMGKLLGLPMGVDACYTNHMDADQNDLENLMVLLVASGVNYFMGVPMGDDIMLSYQTSSFHDTASLREIMNCRPAPEFEFWLEEKELIRDGKLTSRAGDLSYIALMLN